MPRVTGEELVDEPTKHDRSSVSSSSADMTNGDWSAMLLGEQEGNVNKTGPCKICNLKCRHILGPSTQGFVATSFLKKIIGR